ERPITRLRETVEICRRYLADQHVQYNGKVFDITGNGLELGQNFPVPIYIAALGPQMLRLAGEIGDGVLLNWAAPTYLEEVNTHLATGAQLAARNHKDIDRACYIRVAVTDSPDSIKSALDQQLIRYSGMAYYHNHFVQSGFADNMDAIRHHLEKGDRQKAIAAITDEMRCQLAVFGPAEECRQEVERRRLAGVDLPVIAPFALTDVAASYRRTIEAFSN
ncbi:LLM class flavin-dependent oxidoreductase, partial [Dehalococcoidia bacterium]|nr:LLM class flavin-dependent oxidoreductase [Dehalococcoidia bacterium]